MESGRPQTKHSRSGDDEIVIQQTSQSLVPRRRLSGRHPNCRSMVSPRGHARAGFCSRRGSPRRCDRSWNRRGYWNVGSCRKRLRQVRRDPPLCIVPTLTRRCHSDGLRRASAFCSPIPRAAWFAAMPTPARFSLIQQRSDARKTTIECSQGASASSSPALRAFHLKPMGRRSSSPGDGGTSAARSPWRCRATDTQSC